MATSVATAAGAPGAPPPPTRQDHESGGGLLLVAGGLGAAGLAAWLLLRKKTPAASGCAGQKFRAGSVNPFLAGVPSGVVPCYNVVPAYSNQGVQTTIGGQGQAIPVGTELTSTGRIYQDRWPTEFQGRVVPGWVSVVPTDYRGCYAALGDITAE